MKDSPGLAIRHANKRSRCGNKDKIIVPLSRSKENMNYGKNTDSNSEKEARTDLGSSGGSKMTTVVKWSAGYMKTHNVTAPLARQ